MESTSPYQQTSFEQNSKKIFHLHLTKTSLRYWSYGIFVLISVIFTCVYVPLTVQSLMSSPTDVPEYHKDSDCLCSNSVGSNPSFFGTLMASSDFVKQFNGTAQYFPNYAFRVGNIIIGSPNICLWNINYFQMIFSPSNLIHKKTLDFFEKEDPNDFGSTLNIPPFPGANSPCIFYPQNSFCAIQIQNVNITYLNSSKECFDYTNELFNGKFISKIDLGWENESYRSLCSLRSCTVPINSITDLQWFSLISFCGSVSAFVFGLVRIIRYIISYFIFRDVRISPVSV